MTRGEKCVVIVGALRAALTDNRLGGQAFACRSLSDGLTDNGWRVIEVDSSIRSIIESGGLRRLPSAIWRIIQILRVCIFYRPQAALVFCSYGLSFLEKGFMVLVIRLLGVRAILLPRSGHLEHQLDRHLSLRLFARTVFRIASLTICQSEYWRRCFTNLGVNHKRLAVIENWLPSEAFVYPGDSVSRSDGEEFIVGYYSRIERSKGIFEFLEVISAANAMDGRIRGYVYGDGAAVPEMNEWIIQNKANDFIEYRGWLNQDSKRKALRGLDALLFSSHAEGYPNALVEVAALKIPIVSVNIGSVSDILDNGATGKLVELGDSQGAARAVLELANDEYERRQVAELAYARVKSRNQRSSAISIFEDLLN